MPECFEIQEIETCRTVVLRIRGHLDAKSTPILLERCKPVRERRQNLVLNLSGISFIASSGIGGVLALVGEFREAGLSVRLAELSAAVESVIELLNLDSFLGIDLTEEDSLEQLAA